MCFNAFNKEADLDVLDHPVLNFFYYLVSTISAKNAKLGFTSVCSEMICSCLVTPNWCLYYYNSMFYCPYLLRLQLVEILPSSLVLYILRRIPAKLQLSQYHLLSSG